MSCITEILKIKGSRPILKTEGHVIECGGIYKNYEWLVTMTSMAHRCGYVAIPSDHPLAGQDLMSEVTAEAYEHFHYPHGGVTFQKPGTHLVKAIVGDFVCDDIWIGFDAAHAGDKKDYDTARS
jgi:hypothetical protein